MTELGQTRDRKTDRPRRSPLRIALYAGVALVAVVIVCVGAILLFPDPFINGIIKPRITKAIAEAYPDYLITIGDMHYSFVQNRLGCDSVAVRATDSTLSGTLGPLTVRGVGWLHVIREGNLAPRALANAVVDAQDLVLNVGKSHYDLRCTNLRVSVPDSQVAADSVEIHPLSGDAEFFQESAFRRTRFRFISPLCSVSGLALLDMLQENMYRARVVRIQDMALDVLINKDKASGRDTAHAAMPNEIISSIQGTLHLDSLSITNGQLKYAERFVAGAKPAVITFDSLDVLAVGIANHEDGGAPIAIRARGTFMKAATIQVLMSMPAGSPDFSFHYSGSVGRMDLRALNAFLETAEQMRIKEGVLQAATFDIDVASGRASGNVRAVYRELTLAAINKHTGSEKGFVDGIASFIANTFKIRRSNVPDKSGTLSIGKVHYARKQDDPFFKFWWFALRSGLADVVGF